MDEDTDTEDIYEMLAQEEIKRDMGIDDTAQETAVITGIVAQLLVKSMKLYNRTLHLNFNYNHFSRIKNIQKYAKYWQCITCGRIIQRKNNYINHQRGCTGSVKHEYPGGGYGNRPSIFDKLFDEGIEITIDDRFYPFRVVFDYECRFEEIAKAEPASLLTYEKRLIPVSVSIVSNLPGAEAPVCIVSKDPTDLVVKFYDTLEQIHRRAMQILDDKYKNVTEKIKKKVDEISRIKSKLGELRRSKEPASEIEKLERDLKQIDYWESLMKEWSRWLQLLPVVGFNSKRFDLNLIKKYLIPHCLKQKKPINSIKRGSAYLLLSTDTLMFLDVTNFLAEGTSYAGWLAGFGVEDGKSFFPYEWLTDFDLLKQTQLPPAAAFYSTLKQSAISEPDYQLLQQLWVEKGFKTMEQFLVYYNNQDTVPFMSALNKMWNIFKEMNIDMLKSGSISLPGLAQLHMFKSIRPDVVFQIFNEENKNYRQLIQENIVGGPAIIFQRLCIAGEGKIKGTGPPPRSVVGYDANGLYSWSLAQDMPTGIGIKWEPIQNPGDDIPPSPGTDNIETCKRKLDQNRQLRYRKTKTSKGWEELIVVNYMFNALQNQRPNIVLSLRHGFNGKQKVFRFGRRRVPVDGWVPELRTIIQYHGCFYHGHECRLTKRMDLALKQQNKERTDNIRNLLRGTGCTLIEIKQCDYYEMMKKNKDLYIYASSFEPWGYQKSELTMKHIIDAIADGKFFGMALVDIQVPFWEDGLRSSMSEYPPIFKNVEISIDDIGDHMRTFAQQSGIMKKPRTALISSFFATKMLIITPLLRWYIEHGLIVTKLYQALQYVPLRAFSHLTEEVAKHRRQADANPNLAAYGLLFKLIGNSYYGRCLTRVENHMNIKYEDRHEAAQSICCPNFRKVEEITEGVYETQLAKQRVKFDLPINIAFFVYGYAKLRMLQFHKFITQILEPDHYALLETDTDSIYMCIAETLEETVTPERKHVFEQLKSEFLVLNDYDKKTAGLFKLEHKSKKFIGVNPKTYIALTESEPGRLEDVKLSTKGLSKQTNKLNFE